MAVSLLPSIPWYRNAYVMDVEGGDIQPVFRARLTLINQDAAKTLANTSARLECPRFDRRREREKKETESTAFLIAPFIMSCTIMKNNHKKDWKPEIIYNLFFFSEVRSLF